MGDSRNVQMVKEAYAAFGRGVRSLLVGRTRTSRSWNMPVAAISSAISVLSLHFITRHKAIALRGRSL